MNNKNNIIDFGSKYLGKFYQVGFYNKIRDIGTNYLGVGLSKLSKLTNL